MRHLNASGWLLLARMGAWRLALPLLKRTVSLDRLVDLLSAQGDRTRDPQREALIARIGGRLWRSAEGPCLERSLAVYRQLGLSGARPELHAGMAKQDDVLVGHVWVTLDGTPVLEEGDPTAEFSVVVTYDERGKRCQSRL